MMTNTELINLFRNVERSNHPVCNGCPMKYTCDKNQITRCLFGVAADALEADDEMLRQRQVKIADFVAAIDALNDSNDAYIKENERLKKRISELEAQMPKQDKWMINIRRYQQPSQSVTISGASQSATVNVGTTFLCRSTGKLCPNATQYGYCKQTICTIDSVRG